jgi:hypothetical protein
MDLINKSIKSGYVLFLLSILLLTGCSNPTKKVGDNIDTFEDLKKAKEAGEPISEFDKCVKEAEADSNEYDNYMSTCIGGKLKAKGYEDGIDCIQNFTNPICEDISRYNAEIDASNECGEAMPDEIKNRISPLDCTALIN